MESCLGYYFQAIATFPNKSLHTLHLEDYRDIQQSFQQVRVVVSNLVKCFYDNKK